MNNQHNGSGRIPRVRVLPPEVVVGQAAAQAAQVGPVVAVVQDQADRPVIQIDQPVAQADRPVVQIDQPVAQADRQPGPIRRPRRRPGVGGIKI